MDRKLPMSIELDPVTQYLVKVSTAVCVSDNETSVSFKILSVHITINYHTKIQVPTQSCCLQVYCDSTVSTFCSSYNLSQDCILILFIQEKNDICDNMLRYDIFLIRVCDVVLCFVRLFSLVRVVELHKLFQHHTSTVSTTLLCSQSLLQVSHATFVGEFVCLCFFLIYIMHAYVYIVEVCSIIYVCNAYWHYTVYKRLCVVPSVSMLQ